MIADKLMPTVFTEIMMGAVVFFPVSDYVTAMAWGYLSSIAPHLSLLSYHPIIVCRSLPNLFFRGGLFSSLISYRHNKALQTDKH
jgi:hypothetical protein